MIHPSRLDDITRLIYPDGVDVHREYEIGSNGVLFKAFEDGIITVDKLLDHADLKLDWYIPSETVIEFMIFIRLCLGEEPENSNSKPQYFMIDVILQSPNVKPFFMARGIDFDNMSMETVVLCSREFSKSTLITYFILFMAAKGELPVFGKINYGLYVSDSMRNGVKKMMNRLKGIYYESVYLQSLFEDVSFTQEESIFVRHPRTKREIALYNEFVTKQGKKPENVPGRMKRTFKVDGLGCATSARGASNVLTRPQFVFIDDVIANEADASSKIILETIESTIESDIRGGLSGSGYFIVAIGTPFNKNDPIYRRVEEGLMTPVVFPRAVKPPEIGMNELEFEGVWENRHSFKNCKREYNNAKKAYDNGNEYKMRKLMQEHYLRISNDEDRMVPDALLQWFNADLIVQRAFEYNWYMTTDYTTTGSKGSDFSGAALWAVSHDGSWFMMGLTLRKMELEDQYNTTFEMIENVLDKVRWIEVGVELDGGQGTHVYSLEKKMLERNTHFAFARQKGQDNKKRKGILTRLEGGSKHHRFRSMLPMFQNRKIYFAEHLKETPDMRELLEEIKYTTYQAITSRHDDGIDLISQINAIDVQLPSKEFSGSSEPVKKVGMKSNSINAKVWGKKQSSGSNKTVYDSYNG